MRRLLERREREKLTYREAAALEPGVSINQLFWWRRRLLGTAPQPPDENDKPSTFVELVEAPARSGSQLEIVLARGRRIVVSGDVDESALVRVVRALERC